jgi:hypothetical protein
MQINRGTGVLSGSWQSGQNITGKCLSCQIFSMFMNLITRLSTSDVDVLDEIVFVSVTEESEVGLSSFF